MSRSARRQNLDRHQKVRWRLTPKLLGLIGIGFVLASLAGLRRYSDTEGVRGRGAGESPHHLATSRTPMRPFPAAAAPDAASEPRRTRPAAEGRVSAARSSPVDVLLSRVAKMKKITSGRASFINATLRNLREEGASAVPAIGEFLRGGDDVAFAGMSGGELVGRRTLRQAMIATLFDIGGSAAIGVALEQLGQTRQPVEIAMLARGVEAEEPGVHGEQVIRAVDDALQSSEQSRFSAKDAPDVSPLFDVLSRYGGEHAVAVLERSVSRWGEYALIALAGLRDGAGVPSLVTLASAADAPADDRALPLRILAQTTLQHPEWRDQLVDLTRSGRIPDHAWSAMSEALSGKYLRFSSTMFDGTPLVESPSDRAGGAALRRSYYIEWRNVRYEQDVVSAEWSAEQIEEQRALIDDLLAATTSAAAVQALQQAAAALHL